MSHDGKTVWRKKLPNMREGGAVSDSGQAGAYFYTHRLAGDLSEDFVNYEIFKPDGSILVVDEEKQHFPGMTDVPPNPRVRDVFVNDPAGTITFVTYDYGYQGTSNAWRTYDLSAGTKQVLDVPLGEPAEPGFIRSVHPIGGTPLAAVRWSRHKAFDEATTFEIVDAKGKPVWRLDLTVKESSDADDIQSKTPGGFTTILGQRKLSVRYGVTEREEKWQVDKLDSRPYAPDVIPTVKEIDLTPTDVVKLRLKKPAPISNIENFYLLSHGQIAILQTGLHPAIVIIGRNHKVVKRLELPLDRNIWGDRLSFAWLGGLKFVVLQKDAQRDAQHNYQQNSRAWWVDMRRPRIVATEGLPNFDFKNATGLKDGSLVGFTQATNDHIVSTYFFKMDGLGHMLWKRPFKNDDPSNSVFIEEQLCADSQGRLVALDSVTNKLHLFSESGHYLRSVDLHKFSKGMDVDYATLITPDPKGGWFVFEKPHLYHLSTAGRMRSMRCPIPKDGYLRCGMLTDSKGQVWTSDGESLYCLNRRGRTLAKISSKPTGPGLASVGKVLVAHENVYVSDGDTRFESVNRNGTVLFMVRTPVQADVSGIYSSETGETYLLSSKVVGKKTVTGLRRYSMNGRLVQAGVIGERPNHNIPKAIPNGWFWNDYTLCDERGQQVTTLDRLPNGDWMQGEPTITTDGELLSSGGKAILFSRSGKPKWSASLPKALNSGWRLVYNGRNLYSLRDKDVMAFDRNGKPLWRCPISGIDERFSIFPTKDGFAIFDGEKTIRWYRAPTNA
jgi:hypothetical protein